MIRFSNYKKVNIPGDGEALYFDGACSSDDEKPVALVMSGSMVPVAQGSILTETDTGDIYMFNEDSASWMLFASSR